MPWQMTFVLLLTRMLIRRQRLKASAPAGKHRPLSPLSGFAGSTHFSLRRSIDQQAEYTAGRHRSLAEGGLRRGPLSNHRDIGARVRFTLLGPGQSHVRSGSLSRYAGGGPGRGLFSENDGSSAHMRLPCPAHGSRQDPSASNPARDTIPSCPASAASFTTSRPPPPPCSPSPSSSSGPAATPPTNPSPATAPPSSAWTPRRAR